MAKLSTGGRENWYDDVDGVAERMTQAGATVIYPIGDHEQGGRGGRLRDPFGHIWMISQPPA